MVRTSLTEQYDDKDVIKQIYRLWDSVEAGTIADIDIQRNGSLITVEFTMTDGTVKSFELQDDEIEDITSSQTGSTVTVTVTMLSGRTHSYTFETATGFVTTDTEQTITGRKTFTSVGTLTATGLITASGGVDATTIAASTIRAGTVTASTPASDAPNTAVVTKGYVTTTDGTTNNLLHTNGSQEQVVSQPTVFVAPSGRAGLTVKANGANYRIATDMTVPSDDGLGTSYTVILDTLHAVATNGTQSELGRLYATSDGTTAQLVWRFTRRDGTQANTVIARVTL